MATKLLPKDQKVYKWKFHEDKEDPEACIFHIKIRTNRDRINTDLQKTYKLIENEEDFANNVYSNIVKIENVEGVTLDKQEDIIKFCLDRLSMNQGSELQLAIQGFSEYLDKGLVKN